MQQRQLDNLRERIRKLFPHKKPVVRINVVRYGDVIGGGVRTVVSVENDTLWIDGPVEVGSISTTVVKKLRLILDAVEAGQFVVEE